MERRKFILKEIKITEFERKKLEMAMAVALIENLRKKNMISEKVMEAVRKDAKKRLEKECR